MFLMKSYYFSYAHANVIIYITLSFWIKILWKNIYLKFEHSEKSPPPPPESIEFSTVLQIELYSRLNCIATLFPWKIEFTSIQNVTLNVCFLKTNKKWDQIYCSPILIIKLHFQNFLLQFCSRKYGKKYTSPRIREKNIRGILVRNI